jgi:hypothetical protein
MVDIVPKQATLLYVLSLLIVKSNGGGKASGKFTVQQKISYSVGLFWKIKFRPGTIFRSESLRAWDGVVCVRWVWNPTFIYFSHVLMHRMFGRKHSPCCRYGLSGGVLPLTKPSLYDGRLTKPRAIGRYLLLFLGACGLPGMM